MKPYNQIKQYLEEAEHNAITSLATNKWERFGYWAAQSVHLRKILNPGRSAVMIMIRIIILGALKRIAS